MSKSSKKFSAEVRERAVRLVLEARKDHDSEWATLCSIAPKIGCTTETLRKWVRRAERDAGLRPGPTSEDPIGTRTPYAQVNGGTDPPVAPATGPTTCAVARPEPFRSPVCSPDPETPPSPTQLVPVPDAPRTRPRRDRRGPRLPGRSSPVGWPRPRTRTQYDQAVTPPKKNGALDFSKAP